MGDEFVEPHIVERYEIESKLGKGAYGIVWRAYDRQTREVVALKKIFGAFQNKTDSQRTYREVFLLYKFRHGNVVRLIDVIRARNDVDLYLIFEFMEADLHSAIQANILSPIHKEYLFYQTVKAVNYMHHACILHRDLKPANLLLNADSVLKVCDFGLARTFVPSYTDSGGRNCDVSSDEALSDPYLQQTRERNMTIRSPEDEAAAIATAALPMTSDVATRWYCAPEILVGCPTYSSGVDVWALGCILAELLSGHPLFPGKNTTHQLELIVGCLGPLSKADVESMRTPAALMILGQIQAREVTRIGFREPEAEPLHKRFKDWPPVALDLLKKLLVFNPDKRITAKEALAHPFLTNFFKPEDAKPKVVKLKIIDLYGPTAKHYQQQLYNFIEKIYQKESQARQEEKQPELEADEQQAEAVLKQAEADLKRAEADLKQAEAELKQAEIVPTPEEPPQAKEEPAVAAGTSTPVASPPARTTTSPTPAFSASTWTKTRAKPRREAGEAKEPPRFSITITRKGTPVDMDKMLANAAAAEEATPKAVLLGASRQKVATPIVNPTPTPQDKEREDAVQKLNEALQSLLGGLDEISDGGAGGGGHEGTAALAALASFRAPVNLISSTPTNAAPAVPTPAPVGTTSTSATTKKPASIRKSASLKDVSTHLKNEMEKEKKLPAVSQTAEDASQLLRKGSQLRGGKDKRRAIKQDTPFTFDQLSWRANDAE